MLGCVVMAAGIGKRFGANKLMASLGDAVVVERTLQSVPAGLFERVVVTRWPDVEAAARSAGVDTVCPLGASRSESVRAGLAWGADRWEACVFLSGDQPLVRPESFRALAAAHERYPGSPLRLAFGGVPAAPVLFPKRLFDALLSLEGTDGGRSVLQGEQVRLVEALDRDELFDIDTRDDLRLVREHLIDYE